MNRLNSPKKILFLTIIGLVTFVSSIQPILAHSGHNHQQPKQKNPSIEENNRDLVEEETKVNQQKLETTTQTENETINITLEKNKGVFFIPKTSEMLFILLVVNPILLKFIKHKIHK